MLRTYLLSLCLAAGLVPALHAQAGPTATKGLDIQAGASFVGALPDYSFNGSSPKYKGYGIYSSIDFLPHFGLELDYHQVNAPSPKIEAKPTPFYRSRAASKQHVRGVPGFDLIADPHRLC